MNNLTENWRNLLSVSDKASFFQSPECYDFYKSLSFLKPVLVYVEEGDVIKGLVCGYVIDEGKGIKKWMTRRAIIPGGALLHPNISDKNLTLLLRKLNNELKKQQVIYSEFRNYRDFTTYIESFGKAGYQYYPHLNFHVLTPDPNIAKSKLNSTKRRHLKVSEKNGVSTYLSNAEIDIAQFYQLLSELYRTKVKTPLFPYEFFQKIINNNWARFFVVKFGNTVIGGSVCVVYNGAIIYEWFVCGNDFEFKNLYPSTMATWAPIEYGAVQGYEYFDMMGAGRPDNDYGVRDFKSKFGGNLVEFGRFVSIQKPILFFIGKLIVSLIRKNKKFLKYV